MTLAPRSRVAVIGDVGGHAAELRRELIRLGADPGSGRLPPDLLVIQVGDLVHRGPDSAGVVTMVDRYLRKQPGQWVQLVGNHEAQYLAPPAFTWRERLDRASAKKVRAWWAEGLMQVAATVVSSKAGPAVAAGLGPGPPTSDPIAGRREWLITHAGLTEGFWRRFLGAPQTIAETATALNRLIRDPGDVVFRSGQLLGGGRPSRTAGPVWAVAATEVLPGWLASSRGGAGFASPSRAAAGSSDLPFNQIHGHTTLYDWENSQFLARPEIARLTQVWPAARHELTTIGTAQIVGIDPCHGFRPAASWRAWMV